MLFSANLGFLWTEKPLPDAIHAAYAAGFDAVECHWPYDTPSEDVASALKATGLEMLGLNTRRGNEGENGLSALVGRQEDAKNAIDESIAFASEASVKNIHVMAGNANGEAAHKTFINNLVYACEAASMHDITVLIEPLNKYDAPAYFLKTTDQALEIIKEVGANNIKLMFDCYHVQQMEGDLSHKVKDLLPSIGHIQFASVPDRGAPDHGEVNYAHVFSVIENLGYKRPLGAEYKPGGDADASLAWLRNYKSSGTL